MSITVHEALKSIAANDPDLARCINGVGFSSHDAEFGVKLADCERLTAKQEFFAGKLVRRYRKQVAATYLIGLGLKGKARDNAIENFLWSLGWQYQNQAPAQKGTIKAILGQNSGRLKNFAIRFPYNPALVETLKAKLPYRSFDRSDPKDVKWLAEPVAVNVAGLFHLVNECGFEVSDGAKAAFESLSLRKAA
jgi:hypothetical protein